MNDDEFERQIAEQFGGLKVDATKMEKWFEGTLEMLASLARQGRRTPFIIQVTGVRHGKCHCSRYWARCCQVDW